METQQQLSARFLLWRWVLATAIGWIVGLITLIILGGLEGQIGLSGESAIGLGIGGAVGFFQWSIARKWFGASQQWIWASLVGIGIPFLILDLLSTFGANTTLLIGGEYWTLHLSTFCGGLLAGFWQQRVLRSHTTKANWWILISIAGWSLAELFVNAVMLPGHPESALGMIRNMGTLPLGGVVHGLVTGLALLSLLSRAGSKS